MDKNEILKKSREQKEDEGTIFVQNNGRRFGVIGFCSIFVIIMVFNLFTGVENFVPFTMFWAYAAAESYGKYRTTKRGVEGITAVLASLASLGFLICHIVDTLGVGV
ncbi:DUF6442 family protein [Sinanaerobacter sp. ZZT-01]|uniref:DUF6442 family protein n=1 Tax=Sinanaerobacter sp. ZZT-01 TaxID=3111540 RepID=UPI002D782493|nr:DUF6442 family protein [Sinanaerobacter sp. ZZT-01]WRR94472.1 DUF6442 family protein [Sinanaerobacter sp. ZZT-01]